MRLTPVTIATFMALAGPALAADAALELPVETSVFSWSGAYLGAVVGYGWGEHTETEFSDAGVATGFSQDYDSDGFLGGVFAGYNWQSSHFVYGVEADIEYTAIDGGFVLPSGEITTIDVGLQGSLRARLGVAFNRVLIYGTGGVAFADVDYVFTNVIGVSDTIGATRVGFTVGGGGDVAITDRLFGRAEYRYTDFGGENYGSPLAFPGFNYTQDAAFHTVRFGLGLSF
jgi:outer membrane immunogenic protein